MHSTPMPNNSNQTLLDVLEVFGYFRADSVINMSKNTFDFSNSTSYVFLFPLLVEFVIFVLPRDAAQSAVMPRQVVCPPEGPSVCLSVCLSVTMRHADHRLESFASNFAAD